MKAEFPNLRLCEDHWKVDCIATDNYPHFHNPGDSEGLRNPLAKRLSEDPKDRETSKRAKTVASGSNMAQSDKQAQPEAVHCYLTPYL